MPIDLNETTVLSIYGCHMDISLCVRELLAIFGLVLTKITLSRCHTPAINCSNCSSTNSNYRPQTRYLVLPLVSQDTSDTQLQGLGPKHHRMVTS
ncbi:hypothetical protein PoB_002074700 [Plakobranchus ocellatus]|uniref:Uncharacterized protein n=1 Tax=Plakobranchus ocellatus TaxID=259542 RepID=A0AAV3ZI99_9GAST|nr:hypothetical protein PoB_002074700 [Plakobranchus ocellatus]